MLTINPYDLGTNEKPFQSIDPSTNEEIVIGPEKRMHGEFLLLIDGCTIQIDPFVVEGLGVITPPKWTYSPTTITHPHTVFSVYENKDSIEYNAAHNEWAHSFVWESEYDTYTCTIDFYTCTLQIETEQASEKTAEVYKGNISRFIPYKVTHKSEKPVIHVELLIDSMHTLVSPFEKHNELYVLTRRMVDDVTLISDKDASQQDRLDAVERLTVDLQTCKKDPALDKLTEIYKNTKPDPDTNVNVGYDQTAVFEFITQMAKTYKSRLESPIANKIDRKIHPMFDQIPKEKHQGLVDLRMIKDYGLNVNGDVDEYDLTYVTQCTGIAKSTISSLRTGNKSIDSLTIPIASLLTQMGEIYYLKRLKAWAKSAPSPFDVDSGTYWSFDIHTLHGVYTVDYTDKNHAHLDRNDVLSVLNDGQSKVLELGDDQPDCRQFAVYLSKHNSETCTGSVGCPLYGVSGLYTVEQGEV